MLRTYHRARLNNKESGKRSLRKNKYNDPKLRQLFANLSNYPGVRVNRALSQIKVTPFKASCKVKKFIGLKKEKGIIVKIFSTPQASELKNWIKKITSYKKELNSLMKRTESDIEDLMNNFHNLSQEDKLILVEYVTCYAKIPLQSLQKNHSYGWAFLPALKEDLQDERIFSKLDLDSANEHIFREIIKDDSFRKIIEFQNSNNQNPIMPSTIGSKGLWYFKHGDPAYGPLHEGVIFAGKKEKTLYIEPSVIFHTNSDHPSESFMQENRHNIDNIGAIINEAHLRDLSTVSIPIAIINHGFLHHGGHKISITFHLNKHGEIDSCILNNSNRMPIDLSFLFYFLPLLEIIEPKSSTFEKRINSIIGVKDNFFNKANFENLNKSDKIECIKKLLEDKDYQGEIENLHNLQNKNGQYMIFELNAKNQGESGFCLEAAKEASIQTAMEIANTGYPRNGKLRRLRKDLSKKRKSLHRIISDNNIKKRIFGYKNVHKEKYDTNSDLEIISMASDKAINDKIDVIKRYALNSNEIPEESQYSEIEESFIKNKKFSYPPKIHKNINYEQTERAKNLSHYKNIKTETFHQSNQARAVNLL